MSPTSTTKFGQEQKRAYMYLGYGTFHLKADMIGGQSMSGMSHEKT